MITDQLKISVESFVVVTKGKTARINAIASGINKNKFIYQWRKIGSNILSNNTSGVNSTVLTIHNVHKANEGRYYCIVTNEWGRSVRSNDVNLTISSKLVCKSLCMFIVNQVS